MTQLSLGRRYELPLVQDVRLKIGGLASAYAYPRTLEPDCGSDGVKSFMLYARVSYGDRQIR